MKFTKYIYNKLKYINRNASPIMYNVETVKKNKVNLQYCNREPNIGDILSPVVVNFCLQKNHIQQSKSKTKHLFAIGSIIDFGYQDATIWGSGLLNNFAIENLKKAKFIGRKLDIRVVRGPYTKQLLERAGYQCPEKFGDPAVLMPMIYQPQTEKKYKVSVIQHIGGANEREIGDIHTISMVSDDYKGVIDSIVASEKIISSSLHGLILAESYGIPAIFVAKDTMSQLMKYYDWYESTGRREFKIASSYKQALTMEPTELPDLKKMQNLLLNEFPIDIYKE